MHDVLERTCLHARGGEQALASHALERINTCAYAYAERLHAMCLSESVNAYEHTLSFLSGGVYGATRATRMDNHPGTPLGKKTPSRNMDQDELGIDVSLLGRTGLRS